jgi:6-phosphogluconolactonase
VITARHIFSSRPELAAALARDVAEALGRCLAAKGSATLAVSGGSTPAPFFAALAREPLDWAHVTVTLVDERQVPETSPRSNAALVRKSLLVERAAAARFVPLFGNEAEAARLSLDVAVLGMGNDGHTASFFPGGDTLAQAIDPHAEHALLAMSAPGAGEPRLTFTLPKLLAAGTLCLHIEGDGKMKVLEKALMGDDATEMPVRAVLFSACPVKLFWCP